MNVDIYVWKDIKIYIDGWMDRHSDMQIERWMHIYMYILLLI